LYPRQAKEFNNGAKRDLLTETACLHGQFDFQVATRLRNEFVVGAVFDP